MAVRLEPFVHKNIFSPSDPKKFKTIYELGGCGGYKLKTTFLGAIKNQFNWKEHFTTLLFSVGTFLLRMNVHVYVCVWRV